MKETFEKAPGQLMLHSHCQQKAVIGSGSTKAVLEWTSRGRGRDGQPVDYSGVSVLDLRGDKVRRFRAYFDTRALDEHEAEG